MPKEIIINNWTKTYMIGAMSKTSAGDGGFGWREILESELTKRIDKSGNPIFVFNPCNEEQSKVGLNPLEYHKKINGWLNSGCNDKVADGSNLIWGGKTYIVLDETGTPFLKVIPGDDFYVEQSDFLICKIDKGDTPCGTYYEAGYCRKLKKPIYVIQTMRREEYSESFVGWVFASGGDFFPNQTKLLQFIDEKYNLEVKNA
ncbi:MAG: hypothetical protein M0R03_08820 [Novosphingobium sp.]|nr:hypothetical protein [Novosphingobium sp.]